MIYRLIDKNDSTKTPVLAAHYNGANYQEILDFLNGMNGNYDTPRFSSKGFASTVSPGNVLLFHDGQTGYDFYIYPDYFIFFDASTKRGSWEHGYITQGKYILADNYFVKPT